jgi:hypothetical protein
MVINPSSAAFLQQNEQLARFRGESWAVGHVQGHVQTKDGAPDQARFLALVLSGVVVRSLSFVPLAKRWPMCEQNGEVDLRLIGRVGGRMLLLQPPL